MDKPAILHSTAPSDAEQAQLQADRHAAVRATAGLAHDADDLRHLLDTLGLDAHEAKP